MNIDNHKLDELLHSIGKGTFRNCYNIIEKNYDGDRNIIKRAIAEYGLRTTGKPYTDGVINTKTSKSCTIFKNGWQKIALEYCKENSKEIKEYGLTGNNNTISDAENSISSSKKLTSDNNLNVNTEKEITEENLDDKQKEVYHLIKDTKQNLFIQGQAGTGKSAIIQLIKKHAKKKILYMAFTGIAAEKIDGTTINSQFKIAPCPIYYPDKYNIVDDVLKETETIIIDEASMLRPDLFDTMDHLCRIAQDENKSFGGIQIILIGDLYQLPPIYKFSTYYGKNKKQSVKEEELKRYIKSLYGSDKPYFFDAQSYKSGNFKIIELTEVYRQEDKELQKHLSDISKHQNLNSAIDYFNGMCITDTPEEKEQENITVLSPLLKTVKEINQKKLDAIPYSEISYPAINHWNDTESVSNDLPADNKLVLKEGAYVMFCKNDSNKPQRYVNGTKGIIRKLNDEQIQVEILSGENRGKIIDVERARWDKLIFERDITTNTLKLVNDGEHYFIQFPLKLAYAMTIHKAQGQTLDEAFLRIEKGSIWEDGMLYVALSRVKTQKGIFIDRKINDADIHTNQRVIEFFKTQEQNNEETNIKNVENNKKTNTLHLAPDVENRISSQKEGGKHVVQVEIRKNRRFEKKEVIKENNSDENIKLSVATWLETNTSLSYPQIAEFLNLPEETIQKIADEEISVDPINAKEIGIICDEEIRRCEQDKSARIMTYEELYQKYKNITISISSDTRNQQSELVKKIEICNRQVENTTKENNDNNLTLPYKPIKEYFINNEECTQKEFERYLQNKHVTVNVSVIYRNGNKEEKKWVVNNFSEKSNLSNNLHSGYLRNWKERGIKGIRLEIKDVFR